MVDVAAQMQTKERTFDNFMQEVRASLEGHARRKGYNVNGVNGQNALYDFCCIAGHEPGHTLGEITYKALEYEEEPRDVLPIKIAAWAFLLWRKTQELRLKKGLSSETHATDPR